MVLFDIENVLFWVGKWPPLLKKLSHWMVSSGNLSNIMLAETEAAKW
jgi:hypothetical protein